MADDSNEDRARLGSYLPCAFSITLLHPAIGKQPMIGPLQIPRAAFSTFMHEFAHLIQDWATFRGFIDFVNFWDQVAVVDDHARRSGAKVLFPIVDGRNEHRLILAEELAFDSFSKVELWQEIALALCRKYTERYNTFRKWEGTYIETMMNVSNI